MKTYRLLFKALVACLLSLSPVILSLVSLSPVSLPALAQFPGQGNPADWSDALPYYNRANHYADKERYDEAVEDYKEAIARYPYDPDFYINLGFVYRKLEEYGNAEKAFRKAISLRDKDWMSWSNLANALLKQNRLPETIATFEKALKCAPPKAEKEAMEKDIADIKKVLASRGEPYVEAKVAPAAKKSNADKCQTGKAAAKAGKATLKAGEAATKEGAATIKAGAASIKAGKAENSVSPAQKKKDDSGWDYVR